MTADLVFLLKFLNPKVKSFFALAWNKNNFLSKDKFLLLTRKKSIFLHSKNKFICLCFFRHVLNTALETDLCRDGWNVRNCSTSKVHIFGGKDKVYKIGDGWNVQNWQI